MPRLPLPLLAAALVFATPGAAAPVAAESELAAVTVYRDQARVERVAEVALPAGDATVVFEPLPPGLRDDSLNAAAGDGVRIGAVEAENVFTADYSAERERELERAIQGLKDRLAGLDDLKSAAELELEFLRGLARRPQAKDGDGGAAVDPGAWRQAQAVLGEGSRDALERLRTVAIERRPLEAELEKKEKELAQLRSGRKQHRRVSVRVQTERPRPDARVRLTYGVANARWTPRYEGRLDTEAGRLRLVHQAEVRQNTGEEWQDVPLTLSTARPTTATAPPPLSPWFIDFARTQKEERRMMALQEAPRDAAGAAREEASAEVMGREFSAAWRVAGRVTVAANGQPHRFRLAEHPLEVELSARAVPRLNPRAYLFAEGAFPGDAALPAGPLTLFLDGTFRGRSRLPLLRPDEPLRLGYGVDDRLQLEFVDRGRRKDQGGVFTKKKRHERRYLFKVHNRHQRAMAVTLLDQLPVAQHEAITVELLEDADAPDERDTDDKPGLLAWTREVPSKGDWEVRFGYAVSYPADQQVPGFE